MSEALDDLTRDQLLDYAERTGAQVTTRMTKQQLIDAISEHADAKDSETAEATDDHLGFPAQPGAPAQ